MWWYFKCVPLFPVPRGLEGLIQLDQIIVNAQKDVGDYENDLAGKYTPNKYKIHNSVGQAIFHANEGNIDFDACVTRAPFRKFSMKINDNLQNEVIYLKRPGCRLAQPCIPALCLSTCTLCLFPFTCFNLFQDCWQEIEVHCTVTSISIRCIY